MALPITSLPPSGEGYYAINNQFLKNGPKGLMEFKTLENGDTFIRFDLPGVPEAGVVVSLDESKTAIHVIALAPKENTHDFSERIYSTLFKSKLKVDGRKTELVCKCHEINGFTSSMSDGVFRLIMTRTHTATQGPCLSFLCGSNGEDSSGTAPHYAFLPGTDPNDPELSGQVLMPHPCVNVGSKMAYESKKLSNGKLYLRVDMPGVPKDNFTVSVTNGIVKVAGEAPAVSHDSAGRSYSGVVAMLPDSVDIPSRRIKTIAKDGVIRLLIPSV